MNKKEKTDIVVRKNAAVKKKEEQLPETFNRKLVASMGNVMYFLNVGIIKKRYEETGKEIMVTDPTQIHKATVYEIMSRTGSPVIMYGLTERGRQVIAIQEMVFETYKEALDMVQKIKMLYLDKDITPTYRSLDDYMSIAKPNYQYMLKFPIMPHDIILEQDSHYMAMGIEADISAEYPDIQCFGINDLRYMAGKRVWTIEQIMSNPLYEITKI